MLSLQFRPCMTYAIFEDMLTLAIYARVANNTSRHRTGAYVNAVYDELGRHERYKGRSAGNIHNLYPLVTRSADGEA
jgi:hypothetical protein